MCHHVATLKVIDMMSPSVLSPLQVVLGPYGAPVKSINSRGHDPADLALLYERLGVVAVGEDSGADERGEHHVLAEEHVARARGQLHHVHQLRHHVDAVGGREELKFYEFKFPSLCLKHV